MLECQCIIVINTKTFTEMLIKVQIVVQGVFVLEIEPMHEKTNNLGSNQVPHKPGCTVTEAG